MWKVRISNSQGTQRRPQPVNDKPLYDELKLISLGSSKNSGDAKVWICKHYKASSQVPILEYILILLEFHWVKKLKLKGCKSE